MHRKIKDGSVEAGLLLLSMHFHGERLSCGDIAEVCGVSTQAIQQMEARAMRKMKERLMENGVLPHDVFDRLSEPASTANVELAGQPL